MKIFAAVLTVLCIILCPCRGLTVQAEELSEDSMDVPVFSANVEWSAEGWIVKGVFKDFTTDTILVQPMRSMDGETYSDCGQAWNLQWLLSEEEGAQEKLWNQRCLYDSEEPFKSYLSGDLDRFYIKLRVVREGGIVFETEAAVIEREEQPSVPEEVDMSAIFAPSMLVREGRPPHICYYGRYQLTVREDTDEEEILALLPEVLPVEVKIQRGSDYIGSDIVDCPVRWKTLNLPELTAGENVTVADAAEELMVPAGTVLHTQTGRYRVEEPISMNRYGIDMDEVRLILNVIAKDGLPEGALSEENDGLEIVFSLKPTGARAVSVYFLREGDTAWTQIAGFSLTQMVDAQLSTANSGYALVLGKEQEPYLSYRKAQEAGESPPPFLVGVKLEGGVYDGRELVLAWPDSYELPLRLPQMGGSGGNEGNAGSDNKGDSTESGQRPGLSEEEPEEPSPGESDRPSKGRSKQSSTEETKESEQLPSGESQEPEQPSTEEPKKPEQPSTEEPKKPEQSSTEEPQKPEQSSTEEPKKTEPPLTEKSKESKPLSSEETQEPEQSPPREQDRASVRAADEPSTQRLAGSMSAELHEESEKPANRQPSGAADEVAALPVLLLVAVIASGCMTSGKIRNIWRRK